MYNDAPDKEEIARTGVVLVTGGTGRLGAALVKEMAELGYRLRVLTPDRPLVHPNVEWMFGDFRDTVDFDAALKDVRAVIHLGAELWDSPTMERINGHATAALAAAAERAEIDYFCYTSSICVYGSPKARVVTEDSPLTPSDEVTNAHYIERPFMQEYARTKLLGEIAVRNTAERVRYDIFRPTEISWELHLTQIARWPLLRRIWRGYRHSHQIYYVDVVHALIAFMRRGLAEPREPGAVETYNLSDDNAPDASYLGAARQAYAQTKSKDVWTPFCVPGWLDMVKDQIKHRVWNGRLPLGMVRFDNAKLFAAGHAHRVGIA
ncbi:MAG: NAD-dependent epimerase/dehydratase family protein, partial [Maricaulaceae bacterium]